ncbi:MAG: PEP-CTERM sorting domain-containing protein [Verrucomicrobiaceae bacterium]|nr:PEP-CTERM sorting domain-containing protein [Verrucomicrobiaceae bacterium]
MNSRIFVHALMALCLTASAAFGATVSITVNSNNGPCYTTSTDQLLTAGSVIRVGYFNWTDLVTRNVLATSNNYAELDALFTPLGESRPNGGSVLQTGAPGQNIVINDQFEAGHVFGQITGIESTYLPTNTDLVLWVFNSSTASTASEWGIFTTSSGWEFPAALGSQTLASIEVEEANIIRGSFNSTSNHLRLSVVPEPSGLLLLLSTALVVRRRRR